MTTKKPLYSAENVAQYFCYLASQNFVGDNKEREGVTNLKLQKILYFAQAYYLAKLSKVLFGESIEAWEYGPVVPSIYHQFKSKKSNPIICEKDISNLADTDKKILETIWNNFGGYSASRLVDITHAHTPWINAFASTDKEISHQVMADYYTRLLSK